jgi:hypothetical protein
MAELTTELRIDPYPLAHRNPAGNPDIPVAAFWMFTKFQARLFKQDFNTLPGNLFCHGVAGSLFHA